MTLKELEKRIKRLTPGPLLLLCKLPDGSERAMTVQAMDKSNTIKKSFAEVYKKKSVGRKTTCRTRHCWAYYICGKCPSFPML